MKDLLAQGEFVAAIAASFLTVFGTAGLSWIQNQLRRRRERKGLVKLLHIDIANNKFAIDGALDALGSNRTAAIRNWILSLRSDAWSESRSRLVQLTKGRRFEVLASYFGVIEKIQASVRMAERTKTDLTQAGKELRQLNKNLHVLAERACEKETLRFRGWHNDMLVSPRVKLRDRLRWLREDTLRFLNNLRRQRDSSGQ